MKKYGNSPAHLYVNYEGYKALFYECNNENDSMIFEDYFMGLKIILVPDGLAEDNKIYVKVNKFVSNHDLFIEIATRRYKNERILCNQ